MRLLPRSRTMDQTPTSHFGGTCQYESADGNDGCAPRYIVTCDVGVAVARAEAVEDEFRFRRGVDLGGDRAKEEALEEFGDGISVRECSLDCRR